MLQIVTQTKIQCVWRESTLQYRSCGMTKCKTLTGQQQGWGGQDIQPIFIWQSSQPWAASSDPTLPSPEVRLWGLPHMPCTEIWLLPALLCQPVISRQGCGFWFPLRGFCETAKLIFTFHFFCSWDWWRHQRVRNPSTVEDNPDPN